MRHWHLRSSKGEAFIVTSGDDPAAEGIDMRHWPEREELDEAEWNARQRAKLDDPELRERMRRNARASALTVGEVEDMIEMRARTLAAEIVEAERPGIEAAAEHRAIKTLDEAGRLLPAPANKDGKAP